MFSGKQAYFLLNSVEALAELKSYVPDKIDRWDYSKKNFGRMCLGSLDQRRSDKEWKRRRDAIMQTIGINFASKYIPLMIQKIKHITETWKEGEWVEFEKHMRSATFEIITEILFGRDISKKIGKFRYKDTKGNLSEKALEDFIITLSGDVYLATTKLQSIMFPFLIHYNLLPPNNIIYENVRELWGKLREFLDTNEDDKTSDHKSVYAQVLENDPSMDKTLLMMDMILFYFAGHETSSHAVSSLIYYAKKHPEIYEKCFSEIYNGLGVKDRGNMVDLITVDKLDELDYLNCVMKESLRYDNPANLSLGYKALSNISVCGVPIAKGSKIFINIHGIHYNLKQWREPEKFIPERFNPESEYFSRPEGSDSNSRSPYSFVPFSFGLRNCAGKSLATLEIRTLAAYLLMKFDYEIDPEQAKNEFIRFGGSSQFSLKVKITKRY